MYILSECSKLECSKLAQTEYKNCHDKVATTVHWKLCSKYGFELTKHWHEHRDWGQEDLVEFQHQNRPYLEAQWPDIVLIVDKKNQETFIIDVAKPSDFCVSDKKAEKKISKYLDLALIILRSNTNSKNTKKNTNNTKILHEISQMWNAITRVISIVIGALGEKSLLTGYSALIGVMTRKSDSMQQTAVMGSAHILRKVLSIPA